MPHSLFKPKRRDRKTGRPTECRYWWGQYRLDGESRYTRISLRTPDKRVAQKRLDDIVIREEREREGITPSSTLIQAARTTVREHLDSFLADLETRNCTSGYTRKIRQRILRLTQDCGWKQVRDITAASFLQWRQAPREKPLAPKTLNDYQDAIFGLLDWLKHTHQIEVNPLEKVARVDSRGRRTFVRRALTDEEARRLIGRSGRRGPIYLFALHTGLRLGELRSLCWEDVDLEARSLRLREMATKSRRADLLPLSSSAFGVLQDLRERDIGAGKVFASGVPSHASFQRDLERAGIPKLDERGRKVDFHALRMTFVTNLQRAGVPQRHAMSLARHTDSRLTASVYTDSEKLPLADAVAMLPEYGKRETAHPAAHGSAHNRVAGCDDESHAVASNGPTREEQDPHEQRLSDEQMRRPATADDTDENWRRGESNSVSPSRKSAFLNQNRGF